MGGMKQLSEDLNQWNKDNLEGKDVVETLAESIINEAEHMKTIRGRATISVSKDVLQPYLSKLPWYKKIFKKDLTQVEWVNAWMDYYSA